MVVEATNANANDSNCDTVTKAAIITVAVAVTKATTIQANVLCAV